MLCSIAWALILTILYLCNTYWQNKKIKELEKRVNNFITSNCNTHGQTREETGETQKAETTQTDP